MEGTPCALSSGQREEITITEEFKLLENSIPPFVTPGYEGKNQMVKTAVKISRGPKDKPECFPGEEESHDC